jgi:NADPH-dependent 2,4-dienoyl-CoA reductase/sulfur reductase-like enzyme
MKMKEVEREAKTIKPFLGEAVKRREFLAIGASLILGFKPSFGTPRKRVVVVGGGFSGSTCAKYLKMWGGSSLEVILIDRQEPYYSPILSNLVLVDYLSSMEKLAFNRSQLSRYGVKFIKGEVIGGDLKKKRVYLSNGREINYDRLVVAPGIGFKFVNSYDVKRIPHAWIAGEQTEILKSQIASLRDGDVFLMTIPKMPYRCPPGPYERACLVADYLRRKGVKAKIIVLDENPYFVVEKETFSREFARYGIDYRTSVRVVGVSDRDMELYYLRGGKREKLKAKVINLIPNQRAGELVFKLGLNKGDFAPIDPIDYSSTVAPDVHVIGDSQGTSQPKAGHIGNSEAKVCADAIVRELNGLSPYKNPKTNSACYSPVSIGRATWLTTVFKYSPEKRDMVLVNKNFPASSAPSRKNFKDMFNWAGNLFADTFS